MSCKPDARTHGPAVDEDGPAPPARQACGIPAAILLGTFLVALAGVALEVALVRVFALLFRYHHLFLMVSVAVCGLGLGGLLRTYLPARWCRPWAMALLFGVSLPVVLLLLFRSPLWRNWRVGVAAAGAAAAISFRRAVPLGRFGCALRRAGCCMPPTWPAPPNRVAGHPPAEVAGRHRRLLPAGDAYARGFLLARLPVRGRSDVRRRRPMPLPAAGKPPEPGGSAAVSPAPTRR